MASPAEAYARLVTALRQHADLAAALHLLEWDQETFMPPGAAQARARQIGALATLLHERQTEPDFLQLVDELADRLSELDPQQMVDVRETKWRLDRKRRLDARLVGERTTVHAHGRAVWIAARRDNDFAALAPWLARIIEIERRVAAAIDASRDAYDVLLEGYEPGASGAMIESLFRELRQGLLPLVDRLRARVAARPLPVGALCGDFPVAGQRRFNRLVAACLGFDFNRGRLDQTAHPFTTTIGDEVRITTRYDARDLRYSLYSTIHETGHALYEQGLDPNAWGTPRGASCSFGIHESQSRLWENQIGRSEAFWKRFLPQARELFPALAAVSVDAAALAANEARPSLIRTEADEITYNLHVILRFELERALLAGSIEVGALPQAWREKMLEYLGVSPDTDREGVLQDVHWFGGAIGYFPSYALGNIYAAQLLRTAEAEIGSVDALVSAGEFHILLDWLRQHVHRFGQTYRATELIRVATGAPPTPRALFEHLQRKLAFLEAV
jgi:carboxypeptidase Taq